MNFNDTFKSIAVLGGVVCLLVGYQSTLSYLKIKKELEIKNKELETKNKEIENIYKMAQEHNETHFKITQLNNETQLETKNKELENIYKMTQENNETQLKITQLNNETQLKIAELQNTKSV